MKKFSITHILSEYIKNFKYRIQSKAYRALHKKADQAIQVAEFDGIIYITHNGEPVLPASSIKTDIIIQLKASREKLYSYYVQEQD